MANENWEIVRKWASPERFHESLNELGLARDHGRDSSVTLDETSNIQFLALLGQPFAGKSYAAKAYAEYLRVKGRRVLHLRGLGDLYSDALLIDNWFRNSVWRDFCTGDHELHVLIDGWDEAKGTFPAISEVIVSQIERSIERDPGILPRLKLRIFSRHNGWTDSDSQRFRKLFQSNRVMGPDIVLWLLPPSLSEIRWILEEFGVDARDFLDQIKKDRAQALLATAGNIEWIIQTYQSKRDLPSTQSIIFEGITQRLIEDGGRIDSGTALELRCLSERLAFITAVSSRPIISNRSMKKNEDHLVSLLSICGGTEDAKGFEVECNFENLKGCLETGLFTRMNDSTSIWAHQSYQEFLAGKYLAVLDAPTWQKVEFLTNPQEEPRRVYPRLLVVAAWACYFDEQLMTFFIEHDPEALILSGIVFEAESKRAQLIESFLRKLDDHSLTQTRWYPREALAKQHVEDIETVTLLFAADRSRDWNARKVALEVADAMNFHSFAEAACDIALDTTENMTLRVSAAYFVGDHGDSEQNSRLTPLANLDPSLDFNLELRGCALKACYPKYISMSQVLQDFIVPPSGFLGAYRLFIDRDFIKCSLVEDLSTLVDWWRAQSIWERSDIYAEHFLQQLVDRCLLELNDDVLNTLAELMVQESSESSQRFRHRWPMDSYRRAISSKETRRRLIAEYVKRYEGKLPIHETLWDVYGTSLDSLVEDVNWLEDRLSEHVSEGNGELWIRFLARLPASLALELLWERRDLIAKLGLTASILGPIELNSETAETMKHHWDLFYGGDEVPQENEDNSKMNELLSSYLSKCETANPRWWFYADRILQSGGDSGGFSVDGGTPFPSRMPHWDKLSLENQKLMVASAPAFVRAAEVDLSDDALHWNLEAIALVRAVGLLVESENFDQLDLTPGDFARIAPAFLAFSLNYEHRDSTLLHDILMLALSNGFDIVGRLKDIALTTTAENQTLLVYSIRNARDLLTSSEIAALVSDLIEKNCSVEALVCLTQGFLGLLPDESYSSILYTFDPTDTQAVALVASAALTEGTDDTWAVVRSYLLDYPKNLEALFGIHTRPGITGEAFSGCLSAKSLAELYCAAVHAIPPSSDPHFDGVHTIGARESAGQLRDGLLSQIQSIGNWEAVVALENIRPDVEQEVTWIGVAIARARERARSNTESIVTVKELMTLILNSKHRVIHSESALSNVISEQLRILENRLQGVSPLSVGFWNQYGTVEPKDERDMVVFLRSVLVDQLTPLGITVDLETENRRGDKPDIMFQYSTGMGEVVQVPGEVKPCFNKEIFSGMQNQLFQRYMLGLGYSRGIYIPLWMECSSWNSESRKNRHRGVRHPETLADLRRQMTALARDLSSETHVVMSHVLNCSLPEAGRRAVR